MHTAGDYGDRRIPLYLPEGGLQHLSTTAVGELVPSVVAQRSICRAPDMAADIAADIAADTAADNVPWTKCILPEKKTRPWHRGNPRIAVAGRGTPWQAAACRGSTREAPRLATHKSAAIREKVTS